MANTISQYTINAGGTITLNPSTVVDTIVLNTDGSPLAADFTIQFSSNPPIGSKWRVYLNLGGITFGSNVLSVFGNLPTEEMCNNDWAFYDFAQYDIALPALSTYVPSFYQWVLGKDPAISGEDIKIGTFLVDRIASGTPGHMIVWDSSNLPQAVAITGDVTVNSSGVTAIGTGVIVDADVNNSAGIGRNKFANGAANHVVINNGAGAFSSEAQLAKTRGGFGADVSAANGFVRFNSGTLNISSIAELVPLKVSWESGYVGDFTIKMPFDGVVTDIYASLDKAVGAVDAVMTPKNSGGITMGSGTITFTASDPKGTAQTSSPASNNSFVAGDVLTFTTSGGSNAGVAQLSITVTRTN